jgi:hypothetical protein
VDKTWLYPFLLGCVRDFSCDAAHERIRDFRRARGGQNPSSFIRNYLEHRLRERGLVYGTPLASEHEITEHVPEGYLQWRAVFLALQKVQVELALEIGCILTHGCAGTFQITELLLCYALFCRHFRLAVKIKGLWPGVSPGGELPPKVIKISKKNR